MPHLALVVILVAGAIAIYFVDSNIRVSEIQKRQARLKSVHDRNIAHIETSIDKFATFVSSLRAYVNNTENLPSAQQLQEFVNGQLRDIRGYDSLVISYIDTTHTFIYCFNRHRLNSSGLVGKSLEAMRTPHQLAEMSKIMQSNNLSMVKPFNLVEGWVGIPIDFGVIKEGKSIGFIACIVNFKNIVNSAYSADQDHDFVFKFQTSDRIDFDREAVYDGTPIYNKVEDSEYYRHYNVSANNFMHSQLSFHGLELNIGTAFKKEYAHNEYFSILIYSWYGILILFSLLTVRRMYFYRRKSIESGSANELLREGNKLLQSKSQQIKNQNLRLNELINTKNKFFAIISHDVKAPMNSIVSLLQLLKDQKFEDEGIREIVDQLSSSTQSTVKLLENLLNWAKLQTGDLKYSPTEIDLKIAIDETIQILKSNADEKNLTITSQVDHSLKAFADENMISTVIRNAVSNAIKFTPKGGSIKIYHIEDTDQMTIAIADNGIGMAQKEVQQLFKLDSKVRAVGTEGERGTGLGLILCKEFIDRHHGNVCIESELNRGTTFYFTLPNNRK